MLDLKTAVFSLSYQNKNNKICQNFTLINKKLYGVTLYKLTSTGFYIAGKKLTFKLEKISFSTSGVAVAVKATQGTFFNFCFKLPRRR